ncbi:MAG TPA: winged helix-turn-helix domain-containing protein [Bryobacteraceae bacterium]|nr:winged helix-turn-helix domain-containing protein [Bryobacteraceae bacterium]
MPVFRFQRFQLNTATGELRRDGELIYLEPQVAQLLALLIENRGRVVARTELQDLLWPDTNTDRERGLNNAVNRARKALGDSASVPQWIETLPKRGYRFLGDVETVVVKRVRPRIWVPICSAAALFLAIGILWTFRPRSLSTPPPAEYWSALGEIRSGGLQQLDNARKLLETAIRKDPSFAPAYAELTPLLLDLVDNGRFDSRAGRQRAVEAAHTAVRLRDGSAAAHVALGTVLLRVDWRLDEAAREIDRAIWLDPKSAEAWRLRATLFLARGDANRAVEAAERSAALDPLSPWTQTAAGRALFFAGEQTRAVARFEETLRSAPEFVPAHGYLSDVYWQIGQKESARRQFLDSMRLWGVDSAEIRRLDAVTAQNGLPAFWQSQLPELYTERERYGIPYKLALRHVELGEKERALEWLERAIDQKDTRLLFLRVNPQFDELRPLRRFRAILNRLPS